MKSLLQLIHDYHSGVKNAGEEILKRMEPLIKSYASRIHCMERDDATQELYLTLLNTLPYLNGKNFSEGECVRYMQTAIENRYRALCRYHLSEPEREDFDTCSLTLQADNPFDETLYDITTISKAFLSKVWNTKFCLCFSTSIKQIPKLHQFFMSPVNTLIVRKRNC